MLLEFILNFNSLLVSLCVMKFLFQLNSEQSEFNLSIYGMMHDNNIFIHSLHTSQYHLISSSYYSIQMENIKIFSKLFPYQFEVKLLSTFTQKIIHSNFYSPAFIYFFGKEENRKSAFLAKMIHESEIFVKIESTEYLWHNFSHSFHFFFTPPLWLFFLILVTLGTKKKYINLLWVEHWKSFIFNSFNKKRERTPKINLWSWRERG